LSQISDGFFHEYLAKPCLSSHIFGQTVLISSYLCGYDILFLAHPQNDIGGEFKKWGKIPQKKSFFSSRWGVSTTFDA